MYSAFNKAKPVITLFTSKKTILGDILKNEYKKTPDKFTVEISSKPPTKEQLSFIVNTQSLSNLSNSTDSQIGSIAGSEANTNESTDYIHKHANSVLSKLISFKNNNNNNNITIDKAAELIEKNPNDFVKPVAVDWFNGNSVIGDGPAEQTELQLLINRLKHE